MTIFLIELMTIHPWLFLALVVATVLIVEQVGQTVLALVNRHREGPQWDHCEHCDEVATLMERVALLEQDVVTVTAIKE